MPCSSVDLHRDSWQTPTDAKVSFPFPKSVHNSTPAAPTTAPTPNAYSISGQPVAREPAAPAAVPTAVVCMNGFVVVALVVTPAADGN